MVYLVVWATTRNPLVLLPSHPLHPPLPLPWHDPTHVQQSCPFLFVSTDVNDAPILTSNTTAPYSENLAIGTPIYNTTYHDDDVLDTSA